MKHTIGEWETQDSGHPSTVKNVDENLSYPLANDDSALVPPRTTSSDLTIPPHGHDMQDPSF
jgi:hypothetical protein